MPDGMPDPRFCSLRAADYAVDLEFKEDPACLDRGTPPCPTVGPSHPPA